MKIRKREGAFLRASGRCLFAKEGATSPKIMRRLFYTEKERAWERVFLKESEAIEVARQVLALDECIMVAGVINERGEVVGGRVRKSDHPKFSNEKKDWASIGSRAAVMIGAMRASDELLSETESIVFIRKNSRQLLTWIPEKQVIIAAIFPKIVDGLELSEKVRNLFGL